MSFNTKATIVSLIMQRYPNSPILDARDVTNEIIEVIKEKITEVIFERD